GAQVGAVGAFGLPGDPGQERSRLAGIPGTIGRGEFCGPTTEQGLEDGCADRLDQESGPRKARQQAGPIALEVERTVDINRQIRGSRITLEIGQDIDQVPGSMSLGVADDDELDVGRFYRGPKALIPR